MFLEFSGQWHAWMTFANVGWCTAQLNHSPLSTKLLLYAGACHTEERGKILRQKSLLVLACSSMVKSSFDGKNPNLN